MPVKVTVKSKTIHNTRKGILQGSEAGVEATLIALQRQAKLFSPVDKGFLRAGVNKERRGLIGRIFDAIRYAIFQEEGTKRMSAANQGRGFFKPAADKIINNLSNIFGVSIRSGIRRS